MRASHQSPQQGGSPFPLNPSPLPSVCCWWCSAAKAERIAQGGPATHAGVEFAAAMTKGANPMEQLEAEAEQDK